MSENNASMRPSRIRPETPQVDPPPSSGGGGGGGAAPAKVWTISGRLCVRESQIDGDVHDRPLKGIEVTVSARDTELAPWSDWGTVRTDAEGDFSLRETNSGKSRFLRVRARLVGSDLEVNDSKLDDLASFDLLDTNWRTVWKSNGQLQGPAVPIGTCVFAAGGAEDLGSENFRRQALIWYVMRAYANGLTRVRTMLKRCIDPLATDEPRDALAVRRSA